MQTRPNAYELAPNIPKLAAELQEAIYATGLDKRLISLIKTRVSQLNGCAFCLHMHTREAKRLGESDSRLHVLAAWRESTLFSPAERAALAWSEALTLLPQHGAPANAQFDELKRHFSDLEIVGIDSTVAMINFWNRAAISSAAVSPHERHESR